MAHGPTPGGRGPPRLDPLGVAPVGVGRLDESPVQERVEGRPEGGPVDVLEAREEPVLCEAAHGDVAKSAAQGSKDCGLGGADRAHPFFLRCSVVAYPLSVPRARATCTARSTF